MSAALEQETSAPRWAFGRGALIGFVLGVPMVALTVMVLARCGIGNAEQPFRQVLRLTLIFAGAPLVVTAGGVARVAARAAAPGVLPGVRSGALTCAAAGPGLVILAAIPHGYLPETPLAWLWYVPAGALIGAVLGAVIALSVPRG
jgi:hypothetical protein